MVLLLNVLSTASSGQDTIAARSAWMEFEAANGSLLAHRPGTGYLITGPSSSLTLSCVDSNTLIVHPLLEIDSAVASIPFQGT